MVTVEALKVAWQCQRSQKKGWNQTGAGTTQVETHPLEDAELALARIRACEVRVRLGSWLRAQADRRPLAGLFGPCHEAVGE